MTRVGRPRNFDRDEAVIKAMHLFWEKGYEPTSLKDLKGCLGNISSASFYAAFGSKQQLFEECLARYMDLNSEWLKSLKDSQSCARDALYQMLSDTIQCQLDSQTPKGCMTVLAGLNCCDENHEIQVVSAQARHAVRLAIIHCVERGVAQQELPADTNVKSFAMVFDSYLKGLSIEIRNGATYEELQSSLRFIMKLWN